MLVNCHKTIATFPHKRWINKLALQARIMERLLWWTENHICGREQKIHVRDAFSQWTGVTSGVQQGSVFGPLIFLTYFSD